MSMRLCVFSAVVAFATGCQTASTANTPGRLTKDISEPNRMIAVIQQTVPIGSSVASAKDFMQGEGFYCVEKVNQPWGDRQGLDYLYCSRTTHAGGWVDRDWKIAIVYSQDKVVEVLAKSYLTGP